MTPQELKSSILQLAIQGKLVEQRPEEGTGEELYQQIQAEKKRLIQEGKIKKEKPLPEIAEDEVPFEIPESWKWVRVAQVVTLNPKNDLDDHLDTAFIPMPCVSDGFRNSHTFEVKKWGEIKKGFTHFADGDIGVAKITPCFQNRKSVVFQGLPNGYGAGTTELSIVRVINTTILREYLLWFFKSEYFIVNGVKSFTGTGGQQRIHKDYLATCLFPLPPLAEQKRIVAQIEELLPYLDRYEKAWNRLEEFNRRFPADMQKSILQMAIQGKLVEQRPEEGTGEELYRQIQAEKQALIKAGKIKKEKPLPEIAEDEVPFEIPEGWKWCRLLDLCSLIGDIDHNMPKSVDKNHGVLFLSAKDLLDDGSINYIDNVKYISNEDYDRLSRKVKPQLGDIVYSRIGACLGKARTVKSEVKFLVSYSCCIIRSIQIDVDYLRYYLESPIILAHSVKARQSIGVPDLGMGEIKKYFIALPPLAEQKRIVERLEELLPVCERLK